MSGSPAHEPVQLLRDHGLQVTAQRVAVLDAVASCPHGTADDIERDVRGRLGAVSRQAIYDALGVLSERGLIRRIQPSRSPARYETRVDDNHHHLVCRSCGCLVDVDCAAGNRPCLTPADDRGFAIDEAEVIYWGVCPDCRSDPASATRRAVPHPTSSNARPTDPRPTEET